MVHALEEIRRLLKPDGCVIDIHPVREAPPIRIYQGSKLLFAESEPGFDYDADIGHAEGALEEAVRRGLFVVEGGGEYDLIVHASSVRELRDFWAEYGAYNDSPKEETVAARQDEMYARADAIMRSNEGAEIAYRERGRITRLNPT